VPARDRADAADALERLLGNEGITEYLQNVLYARPLPEGADPDGAAAAPRGGRWRLGGLFGRLKERQPAIRAVRVAWEMIPASAFDAEATREGLQGIAVEHGFFRRLADAYPIRPQRPVVQSFYEVVPPRFRPALTRWREALDTYQQAYIAATPGAALEQLAAMHEAKLRAGPDSYPTLGIVCTFRNEHGTAESFFREVLAECQPYDFWGVHIFFALERGREETLDSLIRLEDEFPGLKVHWDARYHPVFSHLQAYAELLHAGCDWVLEMEPGYRHRPSDIPRFFEKMSEGFDCVFGSRFYAGGPAPETTLARRVISRGGTLLTNLLLGTKLTDMTSGFGLFSRAALQGILDRGVYSYGDFFRAEMKVYCHDLRVAEIPIHYRDTGSGVNTYVLRDALINLMRLFRARLTYKLHEHGAHAAETE
jgi:dolichol-phosphate mannosyltransferase